MSEQLRSSDAPPGRRQAWEAATSMTLAGLGIGFIICYSMLVLAPPLPPAIGIVLVAVLAITWLTMAADLIVRIALTPRGKRLEFVFHHPIDVLAVFAPVFRALRVVDLVGRVAYFRSPTGAAVRARIITYAAAYAVSFVYFLAIATLHVERDAPGATITDLGTAIWWACVTVATVGYGDTYPVTDLGRFYAVILMMGGVAIVGTATALIVSYIGDRVRNVTPPQATPGGH